MAHLMGKRRFNTSDDSRNSFILALVTLGEGWHNNHHRFQSSTRNGFYWWEIDPTYYGLKFLSWTGFIWGLKPVPASVLAEGERAEHATSVAAAQRAVKRHPEYSSLRRVVPTAAAMAVATVNAAHLPSPRRAENAAIHQAVTQPDLPAPSSDSVSKPPSSPPAAD
jgi:stearoyl-CoA desaturase (Delta-9 desaturase)